ncbi:MAG: lipopolysaccharide biosynthesis protein [Flavobacteriales bacterium]|nr:MAG: lipopolysaccharide biosynthesis protein [Flavobacteriales bacterium]
MKMVRVQKQIKLFYYIKAFLRYLLPNGGFERKIKRLEKRLSSDQLKQVSERVDYYNKLSTSDFSRKHLLKELQKPKSPKTYYFDTYEYARFFNQDLKFNFAFGDVTHIPSLPSIVKSRPIAGQNENSVVFNLDKARHFVWVKNDQDFHTKENRLIGRCAIYQEHRKKFFEKYFNHPLCDLGQVNQGDFGNPKWLKPKIKLQDHLKYKFILSLEGNDVATNLKWIMSSNSIAVMPKPKYETWFMEGKLVAGKHYIEIKDDYSNLEEQINYYIAHPEECLTIIKHANRFCEQFLNKEVEDLCSLLVLKKYLF